MNRPRKPERCRICGHGVDPADPADHEDCLIRGNPWTGRLYQDAPPEPPEPWPNS